MIITRTPFRISLFGGGTDYPAFYKIHGGAVLGATIDKYCFIMVRKPPPHGPRFKLIYSKVQETNDLEEIEHPAIRECLRLCKVDSIELHHWSDLPARSGVGSSSAFVVGLLHALNELRGVVQLSPELLAENACDIEQDILKETVGSQDQYLCSLGGFRKITFTESVNIYAASELGFLPKWLLPYLMLFDTGVQRTASDIASTYLSDFEKHPQALYAMKGMVDRSINFLTNPHGMDLRAFGYLLDEAWQLKKSLGGKVTNGVIDGIYHLAKKAGAIGGKVLGAGGGGHMLLFVEPEKQEQVKEALKGLRHVPFQFEFEGSRVIYSD